MYKYKECIMIDDKIPRRINPKGIGLIYIYIYMREREPN